MQYKLYKVYTQLSLGRCLTKTQSESVNPAKLSYGKHQSSSQQNYWTIKTIDNLSGSVKLIFVECCEFSDVVNIARRRKKNHDFLLLGSISVWSNSSILSCIGHLAAILSHLLVEFFKVRVYYGSLTLPLHSTAAQCTVATTSLSKW